MEWGVLGPVEVRGANGPVAVGGSRERLVLSRLLLSANRVVAQETLIDDLWEGSPPEGAAQALWVYVSRLRKALRAAGADGVLETCPPGYRLKVEPGELDADRFEQLAVDGRARAAAGEHSAAAELLRKALALWRGPALADVASLAFARNEATRLEEERLAVLEARVQADLACGSHTELIAELAALTREYPLRERLWAHRMTALYRAGRQAEALRAYQDLRRYLGEELGIEPSEELRLLEGAVLRQEAWLAKDPPVTTPVSPADTARREPAPDLPPAPAVRPFPLTLNRAESARFVGREPELMQLEQAWVAARAGEPRLVLLAGEPGIGKSRLAGELARHAHAQGAGVLLGRCDEGMGTPYQPFVDALTAYLAQIPDPVLGPSPGELSHLVPEISERMGHSPATMGFDPETDRYRLFQAVSGWLGTLAGESPVVLLIEDLHWATPPTLAMLRHLSRSAERHRLLVIATYRDTDLDMTPELSDHVAELLRQPGVERLRLSGLDEPGVAAFLEASARQGLDDSGRAFVPTLWRETGGNPFFLGQVIRHLTESGVVQRQGGRWLTGAVPLPDDLADVINRRLSRLPEETRDILVQAAVLGETFDLALLVHAAGDAEISVVRALDPAVAARLLAESGDRAEAYRFVHALVRAAVYDALPSSRRRELHGKAGRAIQAVHAGRIDDHLPALAHHYARSGSADRVAAVEFAARAGDRSTALLAHGEAARWYAQALELLDSSGDGDTAQRCDLLTGLGAAHRLALDSDYATPLAEAVRIADALGDSERLARAALAYGRGGFSEVFSPEPDRIALYERTLASLGPSDSKLRAELLGALAGEMAWTSDPRITDVCLKALEVARRLNDPTIMGRVFATAWPAHFIGSRGFMGLWREEQVAIARQTDDPVVQFMLAVSAAAMANAVGDCDKADELFSHCERLERSASQPFTIWIAEVFRCGQKLALGELAAAEAHARRAFEQGSAAGLRDAYSLYMGQLFWIRYEQGRLDEVVDAFVRGAAKEGSHPVSRMYACRALCAVGREAEARALHEELVETLEDLVMPLLVLGVMAEIAVALDDRKSATILSEHLGPHADHTTTMGAYSAGPVAYYLGILANLVDDTDAAVAHYQAAIELSERMRTHTWAARTRLAWAQLLVRTGGDPGQARDLAAQALATANERGLAALAAEAHALLGGL